MLRDGPLLHSNNFQIDCSKLSLSYYCTLSTWPLSIGSTAAGSFDVRITGQGIRLAVEYGVANYMYRFLLKTINL